LRLVLLRVASGVDRLLTQERLRNYPVIFVVLSSVLLTLSTVQRIASPELFGSITPDYLAHWTGGALFLDGRGADLYDIEAQRAVQADIIGPSTSLSWFVSPPLVAVLYAPLAALDYTSSALIWSLISVLLLAACLWSLRDLAPRVMSEHPRLVVLIVCASASVVELVGGGQDSVFVLAVWLVAIRLIRSPHQVLAGAVLGLALLKPQHVVLVPLVLLASRRLAALGGFVLVALLQTALTLLVVGPGATMQWFAAISGGQFTEQVQAGQAWKMVSIPAFLHALVPQNLHPGSMTLIVLMVIAAAAASLVRRVLNLPLLESHGRKNRAALIVDSDPVALLIAALATTVAFSPHLVVYDAILVVPVALFLLEHRPSRTVRLALVVFFATTWLAPTLHIAADGLPWPLSVLDAPWSAIPLLVLWWESMKLVQQQQQQQQQQRSPSFVADHDSGMQRGTDTAL
jgi:Gpi18-like mannosyltransferase